MVAMSEIRKFARRIGAEFRAEKVILFGSHARGDAHEDSDVDLLVIRPYRGNSAKLSVAIRMKLRPRFPLDLLVRTPAAIRKRVRLGDSFVSEILTTGKLLYEAAHD